MTVTLEPELEKELHHKAAQQGQDADAYLSHLIEKALRQPMPIINRSKLTLEEVERRRQARLARASARDLPASASDFRRENIYEDGGGL